MKGCLSVFGLIFFILAIMPIHTSVMALYLENFTVHDNDFRNAPSALVIRANQTNISNLGMYNNYADYNSTTLQIISHNSTIINPSIHNNIAKHGSKTVDINANTSTIINVPPSKDSVKNAPPPLIDGISLLYTGMIAFVLIIYPKIILSIKGSKNMEYEDKDNLILIILCSIGILTSIFSPNITSNYLSPLQRIIESMMLIFSGGLGIYLAFKNKMGFPCKSLQGVHSELKKLMK